MIESMAKKWVNWIKATDPEFPISREVLEYAALVTLNLGSVLFLSLIIGLISGKSIETLMGLSAFVILRMFSGGFHFKSLDVCAIISAILVTPIPHITMLLDERVVTMTINGVSLIVVALKAPTSLKNTRYTDRIRPIFKAVSILIVSSNFFFQSPVLTLSFFTQALLLLPRERR
ncbi:accessory gene regulator ArgB-like protein [Paenibacillus tyrfis]|uniref:accessory gene regulator ArgB-like protein n=1 Tax=Paenibacillus tyrfis TaxID=1501230 RepID=UPI000B58DE99|nr:accessory gene regulator B family protein [Paenibacillus tyrfis]